MSKIIISVTSVAFALIIGYAFHSNFKNHQPTKPNPVTEKGPVMLADGSVKLPVDETNILIDTIANEFLDDELINVKTGAAQTTEISMIALMHHMTHQKVVADEKWFSVEMTHERLEVVKEILKQHSGKEGWNQVGILIGVVNRWLSGDFSEIADDHNYLWGLEGGTIGFATDVLSPEEEKKFIEENFRKIKIEQ